MAPLGLRAASQRLSAAGPGCSGRKLVSRAAVESPVQSAVQTHAKECSSALENNVVVSPHSDAVRRRREAEERQKRRELERLLRKSQEDEGVKWYQAEEQPPNCRTVDCVQELHRLFTLAASHNRLLVLNFFTEDCYSCRTMHKKLLRIMADNQDVVFVKLNGSLPELQPVFERKGIERVPYFHFYMPDDQSQPCAAFSANLNPEKLALLRRQLAAYKAAAHELQAARQHHGRHQDHRHAHHQGQHSSGGLEEAGMEEALAHALQGGPCTCGEHHGAALGRQ